jgi:flagellar hook-length control protein FliK
MNNISQNIEIKEPGLLNLIGQPNGSVASTDNGTGFPSFENILGGNLLTGNQVVSGEKTIPSLLGEINPELPMASDGKGNKGIIENNLLNAVSLNLMTPIIVPDNIVQNENIAAINNEGQLPDAAVDNAPDIIAGTNNTGTDVAQNIINIDLLVSGSNVLFDNIGTSIEIEGISETPNNESIVPLLHHNVSSKGTTSEFLIPANSNNNVNLMPGNFDLAIEADMATAVDIAEKASGGNALPNNTQALNLNIAGANKETLIATVIPSIIKDNKIIIDNKAGRSEESPKSSKIISPEQSAGILESGLTAITEEKSPKKNIAFGSGPHQSTAKESLETDYGIEPENGIASKENAVKSNAIDGEQISEDNSIDLNKDAGSVKSGTAKNTVTILENRFKADSAANSDSAAPIKFVMPAEFNKAALKNGQTVIIKLKPESLGQIRLTLSSGPDSLVGRVVVESNAARSVIESNLDQLYSQLSQQGIKVDSFSVTLNNGQSGYRFAQSRSTEDGRQQARWKKEYQGTTISKMTTLPASASATYIGAYGVNCFA